MFTFTVMDSNIIFFENKEKKDHADEVDTTTEESGGCVHGQVDVSEEMHSRVSNGNEEDLEY